MSDRLRKLSRLAVAIGGFLIMIGMFLVSAIALTVLGVININALVNETYLLMFMLTLLSVGILDVMAGIILSRSWPILAIRRKVSIFIGMMQNMLGSLAAVFAYVLYYNFFNVQAVLNVPKTDVLLYMFLLLAFGTLSIISGLFLVNEQWKPENENLKETPRLKRELGLLHTTMIGIGGAISAGVFVMLGYATTLAGTTVIIALILCGIINVFTMCSYAELGAALPKAGGEYTFAKVAYGGFTSFFTGWFEWISNMFFAALSAVGFAYMIPYIIPVPMPPALVALLAITVIAIFAAINVRGIKEAGTAEAIMIIILLIILVAYILGGLSTSQIGEFQLNAPQGALGVIRATAFIFAVYLGAEAVAVAQAEIKNPNKTIPRAILLSSGTLIVFYTLIAFVTLRIVPVEQLSGETAPIIFAAGQALGKVGIVLLVIGGSIAALSSLNTSIMAQSRVAYALSRDGYFPKTLMRVHDKFSTPHIAVIVGATFTAVLAATGVINFVGYATDFGFIIGFALVNLSLIKLRREKPLLDRPFKTPFYPFTPIAGIVTSLFLLVFIDVGVLSLGVMLCILAVLAYYIRMVGYLRFRVAFGGIAVGLGGFTALLTYLISTGILPLNGASPTTVAIIVYILVFASVIQILAGILNVTGKSNSI